MKLEKYLVSLITQHNRFQEETNVKELGTI